MIEEYVTIHKGRQKVPLWSKQHKLLLARKLPHSRVKIVDGKKMIKRIFPKGNDINGKSKTWYKWRRLVNMDSDDLRNFSKTSEGRSAGLSRDEARKLGIKSGRESAGWILRMQPKGKTFESALDNWSPEMWEWAKRQNSFNSRMRGNPGPLFRDGEMTRKHTALLIWGHNPRSKLRKVRIPKLRRDGHVQRYWVVHGKKNKNPIIRMSLSEKRPSQAYVLYSKPGEMFIGGKNISKKYLEEHPEIMAKIISHEERHDTLSDIMGAKASRGLDIVDVPALVDNKTGELLNPKSAFTTARSGKESISKALEEIRDKVSPSELRNKTQKLIDLKAARIKQMREESSIPRVEE